MEVPIKILSAAGNSVYFSSYRYFWLLVRPECLEQINLFLKQCVVAALLEPNFHSISHRK